MVVYRHSFIFRFREKEIETLLKAVLFYVRNGHLVYSFYLNQQCTLFYIMITPVCFVTFVFHTRWVPELYVAKVPSDINHRPVLTAAAHRQHQHRNIQTYTGCKRRNGPDFGRVFLMLNYTEKPQNTYIQSWTVWEIMAIEKFGLPSGPRTIAVSWNSYLLVELQQAGVLRHHSTFQYDV